MILTKEELAFLKGNKKILNKIFSKRIADLKERVFKLPAGQDRDVEIVLINELEIWLNTIDSVDRKKEVKQPSNI